MNGKAPKQLQHLLFTEYLASGGGGGGGGGGRVGDGKPHCPSPGEPDLQGCWELEAEVVFRDP